MALKTPITLLSHVVVVGDREEVQRWAHHCLQLNAWQNPLQALLNYNNSCRAQILFRREFHQVGARAEIALAQVGDSWMSLRPPIDSEQMIPSVSCWVFLFS